MTSEKKSKIMLESYAKRRPWSRTDTARWLSDRQEPVMAWLRLKGVQVPGGVRQVGYWMKDKTVAWFDRVHRRLAAMEEMQREKLRPGEVLK